MRRVLAFVAVSAVSSVASANGRFPYANHLVVDPSDAKHVVVRTTYGMIQTFDSGTSWKWVCEQSVGYGGAFDPAIAVSGTGREIVGLFDGLTTSADRGCSYQPASEAFLQKQFLIDFVVQPTDPKHVVGMTSTGSSSGFHVVLAESKDGGATWSQLGDALPLDFNSETLEIAPSRPERLYLSGVSGEPRAGVIFKSDDAGKTWIRSSFDLKGGLAPYLAAVDPKDPQIVYVRLDGDSTMGQGDSLWRSADGGATWTQIGQTKGEMLGFALSPDGSKVAFGGPSDGVWLTSTTSSSPAKTSAIGARCLTWAAAGLYACANEYPDGFTVGLSNDEGKTFKPLNHLAVLSPLECAAPTSTGSLCPKEWPKIQATIGTDDAGTSDAGPTPTPAPPSDDPSCGCSTPGRATGALAGMGTLFGLILGFARRKSG